MISMVRHPSRSSGALALKGLQIRESEIKYVSFHGIVVPNSPFDGSFSAAFMSVKLQKLCWSYGRM